MGGFNISNLSTWKRKLRQMLEDDADGIRQNTDHPDCPDCGSKMNFFGGYLPVGEGY